MGVINLAIKLKRLITKVNKIKKDLDERTNPFEITLEGTTEGELPSGTIAKCLEQLNNFAPIKINVPDMNLVVYGYSALIISENDIMFYSPYLGYGSGYSVEFSISGDDEMYHITELTNS